MEQHSGLNLVDLIVFAVILVSGALALWRGFVREMLSLAAWSGAALVTAYFYPMLRPWMHKQVGNGFAADTLTGLVLFCVALAILIPLGFFISGFVRGRALTAVDRSLGFIFGLARGALVVCLLFLITMWVWPEKEKEPTALAEARTRPYMAAGAEEMKSLLPEDEMKKAAESIDIHDEKTKEEKDKEAKANNKPTTPVVPLDQPPTPSAVTTTVKVAPLPQDKPSEASSSKDEMGQVINQLINPAPSATR